MTVAMSYLLQFALAYPTMYASSATQDVVFLGVALSELEVLSSPRTQDIGT
jgi:hypothetical protein